MLLFLLSILTEQDTRGLLVDRDTINISENDILGYFMIKYKPRKSSSYVSNPIHFVLYKDKVPKTVENFISFAKGYSINNTKYEYTGSVFHRIIKDFVIQGGDIVNKNGTGSVSIYNRKFEDENFLYKNVKGSMSMANSGKNTNGCQFFICMKDLPHLDNKHVVFGQVLGSMDVLKEINDVPTDIRDRPIDDVIINKIEIISDKEIIKDIIGSNKNIKEL
ncbi:hypothetical protein P3W45_000956 [Vairimorpha bombi]|jgi:cyclophilin family peptidyl-prolyl cis-trans isomerase